MGGAWTMAGLAAAGAAWTATALAADAPAQAPGATDLSGVTVAVPRTPPSIVSTYPAAGSTVRPGVLVLKVTFDQPMADDGWSYAKTEDGDYPACLAKPRRLEDGKTFVLLCTAAPSRHYSVRLSDGAEHGFVNIAHRIAPAFVLQFTTSATDAVRSLPEALKLEGLKEDQGPVETTEVAGR